MGDDRRLFRAVNWPLVLALLGCVYFWWRVLAWLWWN